MSVYVQDSDFTLYHGDALDTLRQLPDALVTRFVAGTAERDDVVDVQAQLGVRRPRLDVVRVPKYGGRG